MGKEYTLLYKYILLMAAGTALIVVDITVVRNG